MKNQLHVFQKSSFFIGGYRYLFFTITSKKKLNYLKNIKLKLNDHEFDGFFMKNKMDEAFYKSIYI